MIALKKILFPTDFSDNANYALNYVRELAHLHQSEVTVLNVVEATDGYLFGPTYVNIDLDLMEAARNRMKRFEVELRKETFTFQTKIAKGKPFIGIINAAKELEIDLIIMATHGYGPVKHMLLGSTSEKVVQKAPCPVLTIRHPEHEFVHP